MSLSCAVLLLGKRADAVAVEPGRFDFVVVVSGLADLAGSTDLSCRVPAGVRAAIVIPDVCDPKNLALRQQIFQKYPTVTVCSAKYIAAAVDFDRQVTPARSHACSSAGRSSLRWSPSGAKGVVMLLGQTV